ncbi:uncharacterized protein TRAVEDRAFT_28680 [Trametes versicolor FP-101664 SS1]|uniref:uncharacterized protein n=1 Tax=Trametes versicolor (strain FP-101664) TaxID=717944 RepID=UPI000462440D|nr:uncharacterized protein TRAVEDRAFT_28680 [Trametes versicolor FP-101664 SS1]EIW59566.1 hypothetical protein TRAVEDRAFT_28680 [Trametes versicolor FP-101664 SS1]
MPSDTWVEFPIPLGQPLHGPPRRISKFSKPPSRWLRSTRSDAQLPPPRSTLISFMKAHPILCRS